MSRDMANDEPIAEMLSAASQQRRADFARRRSRHFVRGPIPMSWLERAAQLPGKALTVGLLLWFKHGIQLKRREKNIRVTGSLLRRFAVSRHAAYRAIELLEKSTLVKVERRAGRATLVQLISIAERNGA